MPIAQLLDVDDTDLTGADTFVSGDPIDLIVDEATLRINATFPVAATRTYKLRLETDKVAEASEGFSAILMTRQGPAAPGNLSEHLLSPSDADANRKLLDWFHTSAIRRSGRTRLSIAPVGGAADAGFTITATLSW